MYEWWFCHLSYGHRDIDSILTLLRNILKSFILCRLEYGRTCKDIGCLSSEKCEIVEDSCSWNQQKGQQCGTYPTCKRTGAPSVPGNYINDSRYASTHVIHSVRSRYHFHSNAQMSIHAKWFELLTHSHAQIGIANKQTKTYSMLCSLNEGVRPHTGTQYMSTLHAQFLTTKWHQSTHSLFINNTILSISLNSYTHGSHQAKLYFYYSMQVYIWIQRPIIRTSIMTIHVQRTAATQITIRQHIIHLRATTVVMAFHRRLSTPIKYSAIQIVNHNRINRGTICQFSQIQRRTDRMDSRHCIHKCLNSIQINSTAEAVAAAAIRTATIRIHFSNRLHSAINLLEDRSYHIDRQHVSPVFWINSCTINKADDDRIRHPCMTLCDLMSYSWLVRFVRYGCIVATSRWPHH